MFIHAPALEVAAP